MIIMYVLYAWVYWYTLQPRYIAGVEVNLPEPRYKWTALYIIPPNVCDNLGNTPNPLNTRFECAIYQRREREAAIMPKRNAGTWATHTRTCTMQSDTAAKHAKVDQS